MSSRAAAEATSRVPLVARKAKRSTSPGMICPFMTAGSEPVIALSAVLLFGSVSLYSLKPATWKNRGFDSPKDVKGTAFLNYTHKVNDDDQWLYLPALKRVKRISSRNKSGSFMGSEFAYEDIASQEVERYTYKWLRDEMYANMDCYVIERSPADKKNSGYSRQVVWIDKQEYRTWKIEYFDRKNALLKTLTMNGFQQYIDKFWRADEMNMINHQTGKSTLLAFSNYHFAIGFMARDFDKNSLKRAR